MKRIADYLTLKKYPPKLVNLVWDKELSLLALETSLENGCHHLEHVARTRFQDCSQIAIPSPYARHGHVPLQNDEHIQIHVECIVAGVLSHCVGLIDRIVNLSKIHNNVSDQSIWPHLINKPWKKTLDGHVKMFLARNFGKRQKELMLLQRVRNERTHARHFYVHAEFPPFSIFFHTGRFPTDMLSSSEHLSFTKEGLHEMVVATREFVLWWCRDTGMQIERLLNLPPWETVAQIMKDRHAKCILGNYKVSLNASGEIVVSEDN